MICCTVHNKSFRQIEAILKKVQMAEIRLDLCTLTDSQIERIFSSDVPLIATCRAWGGRPSLSPQPAQDGRPSPTSPSPQPTHEEALEAERTLMLAIRSGAHYADLEIEAPQAVARRIARLCADTGTVLVRSYHNFEGTPSIDELRSIVDRCRAADAQVVKIVTKASDEEDEDRIMSLYRYYTPESLVAFAMSKDPRTRLECLEKGAPWSYCAPSSDDAIADGQLAYAHMYGKVYGDREPFEAQHLRMPCSKSHAQRAIIAAALAEGTSVLSGFTDCGDSLSALKVAQALGAKVVRKRGAEGTSTLEITGIQAREPMLRDLSLNAGESGLLARLCIPLACQLSSLTTRINGEGTLLKRSLQGLRSGIEALGGTLVEGMDTVPLSVKGPLRPGLVSLDGSKSSQLVSGAVMALCMCPRNSTIKVQNPTSIPYLYMTLDLLRRFGIKVRSEMYGGRKILDDNWSKCTEIVLKIKENQFYKAADISLEGDWSTAAVFLAAGAIFGSVTLEGLDTTSLQADLGMLDILMDAGASLSQLDEPTGTICCRKAPLCAVRADLSNSPDLFPVVSVFCAFCEGTSILKGTRRLIHKESDRAEGILEMLTRLGVKAATKGDSLSIEGHSLASRIMTGNLLHGGDFSSHGDHRMVMALRLAEKGADSPINIDDTACVSKSYPQFGEVWDKLSKKV